METNPELALAWNIIERTGTHLFLTGKAGTGKTTFLKRLRAAVPKRMVVVAPTAVAAINASGVTMHSFFQLAFGPYVPDSTHRSPYRFGREKIAIIRSMDLLVIDEISMVRADLLDAVDAVLRRYRDRSKPFGGVQLLMIGDMQQLPPVVQEREWSMLKQYYDTPYFFGSLALRRTDYTTVELSTVYRQSDKSFLALLNRIRDNTADTSVLSALNQRYIPGFGKSGEDEGYIRLTTHNNQAQVYNEQRLGALSGPEFTFTATIEGIFPEAAYPADQRLTLKKGAQVMFLKNDTSGERRYYNGKIGVVVELDEDSIRFRGEGDDSDIELVRETWTNTRYTLDEQTKEISEQEEGRFEQYPLRLAWAITIHKSQGLTFERAVVDAGFSFAHGQVYVALSRCRTLEGLVLGSPLTTGAVICDETVRAFDNEISARIPTAQRLGELEQAYFIELLDDLFGFGRLGQLLTRVYRILEEFFDRHYPNLTGQYRNITADFHKRFVSVSETFGRQYRAMIMANADYRNDPELLGRIKAAAGFFLAESDTLNELPAITKVDTDNKEIKKRFCEASNELNEAIRVKQGLLEWVLAERFSVPSYLREKARLTLSGEDYKKSERKKRERKTGKESKAEVPVDILNPALYEALVKWRRGLARELSLPAYTIIHQKAILGISNLLPRDEAALMKIPHIGKKTIEKYGQTILSLVADYTGADTPRQETLLQLI